MLSPGEWVSGKTLNSEIRSYATLSAREAGGSIARARRARLIEARGTRPNLEYRLTKAGATMKKNGSASTPEAVSTPVLPEAIPVSEPVALPIEIPRFLVSPHADSEVAQAILDHLAERASLDKEIADLKRRLFDLERRRRSAHLLTLEERLHRFLEGLARKE